MQLNPNSTPWPLPEHASIQVNSQDFSNSLATILEQAETLLDLFDQHVRLQSQALAYTFLPQGDGDEQHQIEGLVQSLSYGQLQQRAHAWGAQLQAQGQTGQPVLLMFPAGLEFIVAFLACLYAGAVAVPCVLARNSRHFQRVALVLQDCAANMVLTTGALQASLQQGFAHLNLSHAVQVDVEPGVGQGLYQVLDRSVRPGACDLAFLQYTSGSTGQPKGVAVTHGQLLANELGIQQAGQAPWGVTVVGWLPQYHDMGLVGNLLLPLSLGGHLHFFSPMHFIQRPLRWLRLLANTRAQISSSPNFGLALCNRLPWQDIAQEQLDFSALQTLFCGAEPIAADTLLQFEARLKPFGLKPGTVQPCYGLAESTLMLTGGHGHQPRVLSVSRSALAQGRAQAMPPPSSPAQALLTQELVNCGQAIAGHCVVVVNPKTLRPCAEGEVGEIWAHGPSMAQGYWGSGAQRLQHNRDTFAATLAPPFPSTAHLRTGDLGFVLQGCLYVTGRSKDLIVIRGCNHYPQDLEGTMVQACPHFMQAAAFAVPGAQGQEAVGVLVELSKRDWTNPAYNRNHDWQKAQMAVLMQHGINLHGVHWVGPMSLPRTSSGKVQRHACQALYIQHHGLSAHLFPNPLLHDPALQETSPCSPSPP